MSAAEIFLVVATLVIALFVLWGMTLLVLLWWRQPWSIWTRRDLWQMKKAMRGAKYLMLQDEVGLPERLIFMGEPGRGRTYLDGFPPLPPLPWVRYAHPRPFHYHMPPPEVEETDGTNK